ncbi:MAG: flagellar hook-basal body complex protein FliE [Neptuniibacter caesariensis]|uniref:Flagellar hook-basal body complex protein FliE n=1 Tax=Neptuniibacter caesariensis TaxID=207954 RepID=A0A2G6JMQ3_NEPCE|nr:MAG: flagellar hook-basal body complex protein FliE [Neptuniibacter caesariensis]
MIDRADINSVLMQMRELKSQVQSASSEMLPVNQVEVGGLSGPGRTGFGEILKAAVDGVNETQMDAKKMAVAYEVGDPTVDLPQVMIAAEKASVSFQAMTQVRNRLVAAYEDVMKMPI